jgi:hypothetical protein
MCMYVHVCLLRYVLMSTTYMRDTATVQLKEVLDPDNDQQRCLATRHLMVHVVTNGFPKARFNEV